MDRRALRSLVDLPGLAWAGAGAVFAVIARVQHVSTAGEIAWLLALLVSWRGYGIAFERAVRRRTSEGLTIVSGLAALMLVSIVLSACHVLSLRVQVGVVLVGIVGNTIARVGTPSGRRAPWGSTLFTVAVVLALLATAALLPQHIAGDGTSYPFIIKKLWDTGSAGVLHHQLGLAVFAESYAAIGLGAHAASVFEAGLAPALILLVVWSELATSEDSFALPIWCVLAIPIAANPAFSPHWSGGLWIVAAFFAMRSCLADRKLGAHALLFAAGLAAVRHEYWVFAVPIAAFAIWAPKLEQPTRRTAVIALASWFVITIAMQLALGTGVVASAINSLQLLAALPIVALVLVLLGSAGWRSPLAVIVFASGMYAWAVLCGAIRVAQHDDIAFFTCWYGAVAALLLSIDSSVVRAGRNALHAGAAAIAAAVLLAQFVVAPNFKGLLRTSFVDRYGRATLAAKNQRVLGLMRFTDDDVRACQADIPAGAHLGFWGRSAALLDFHRNSIRDVSWPAKLTYNSPYLAPLAADSFAHLDYVIVEDTAALPITDSWGTGSPSPLADVADLLEPVAAHGIARVFRVKR